MSEKRVLDTQRRVVMQEIEERVEEYQHDDGKRFILKGKDTLASEKDGEWYVPVAIKIAEMELPRGSTIAHIGGGYCILPRLLHRPGITQTVYELEPAIIAHMTGGAIVRADRFTFVQGDYRETLSGTYDVIIYDLNEPANAEDEALMRSHLNENGKLLFTWEKK